MNQQCLFLRLVENAMDFLSHSIDEFDEFPKYSAIHFHASVELFLKARLMAEHWSLVVSKRKDPDWEKFIAGDFLSVTLDEAVEKLEKVVRDGLTKQEYDTFLRLTKHRNKLVHFFHESISDEENRKLRTTITKEQLIAWHFLYKILTNRWDQVFSQWSDALEDIDKKLRTHQEYLRVVFEQLTPKINNLEEDGTRFKDCPSCGFRSQVHSNDVNKFYEAKCLVCGLTENCILTKCPGCGTQALFINEGFGKCDKCRREFEPEYLVEILTNHGASYVATMDGDDSWNPGNCSSCDGYHTVVRLDDGNKYLCACCFEVFDSMEYCGYCSELNTGDMEYSHLTGCNFCEGTR